MNAAQKKLLRAALRGRSQAELKALFALVRANDDRALLAALTESRKAPARRADTLARELERTLRPILGPASEKAELLVEHMARKHKRALDFAPKGLADAARRLRASFSDADILAGAKSLVKEIAARHGREGVV